MGRLGTAALLLGGVLLVLGALLTLAAEMVHARGRQKRLAKCRLSGRHE
jgi:hypothetical protein